jgi:hypothetical protein
LAGALSAVTNANAFRDMAGLAGTQTNAAAAFQAAANLASNFGSQAAALKLAEIAKDAQTTQAADKKLASVQRAYDKGQIPLESPQAHATKILDELHVPSESLRPHQDATLSSAIQETSGKPGYTIEATTAEGMVRLAAGDGGPTGMLAGFTSTLDNVRQFLHLLLFKVPDDIVSYLGSRSMKVQYAHDESYSNDLNTDWYRVKIEKFPTLNGQELTPEGLIKYIRLNINTLINTSYAEFYPYESSIDSPQWNSDNPRKSVIGIDIGGPDNASVVVSAAIPTGWIFSTIITPNTGHHPVSGHRDFYIFKSKDLEDVHYFDIKGLDMVSTGVAGAGFPIGGSVGYYVADKLWKSMQDGVVDFINSSGGKASKGLAYSERVEWRFVYHRYKYDLAKVFGKGAGSPEGSSFFD